MLLKDSIKQFLDYKQYQEACAMQTLRAYKSDLKQVLQHSKYLKLNQNISQSDWRSFIFKPPKAWLCLSPASKNRKLSCLKAFFYFLFKQKISKTNWSHLISLPKVPQKQAQHLSLDEALHLITALKTKHQKTVKKNQTSCTSLCLVLLLYGSGLRVSEACDLKWSDVNFYDKHIVFTGKGGKQRLVNLLPICIYYLQQLKTLSTSESLLNIHSRTAYNLVRQAGKLADLDKKLSPHILRHSFATHLLVSGANLRHLQTLLGHSHLSTTQKYTHLNVSDLARSLTKHHPFKKL